MLRSTTDQARGWDPIRDTNLSRLTWQEIPPSESLHGCDKRHFWSKTRLTPMIPRSLKTFFIGRGTEIYLFSKVPVVLSRRGHMHLERPHNFFSSSISTLNGMWNCKRHTHFSGLNWRGHGCTQTWRKVIRWEWGVEPCSWTPSRWVRRSPLPS